MRAFALTVALALAALGAVRPAHAQNASVSTIAVDEVRPGMRGYGLTVFRGETPERFDVEVIDVLHGFRPGQDIILIRTDHPLLANTASVAGMSGSPIYLDGRLAGAYAYGWPFGKDPIAGVTPIANMLAETSRRRAPNAATASSSFADPDVRPLAEWRRTYNVHNTSPVDLVPAQTPLFVGGLGEGAVRVLSEALSPFGILPMQGGAGSAPSASRTPARFVDGGAVAVTLVRGDVSAQAVGTVTLVRDRDVLAFGHPMLNAGSIALPTSTARVLHLLASTQRSFKIAEAVSPLGTLVEDRQAAIVIDPSLSTTMIPVRVRISGVPNVAKADWSFEVAQHRMLTPALLLSTLTGILEASVSDAADTMLTVGVTARVHDHGAISFDDQTVSRSGFTDTRALERLRVFSMLGAVYSNPFEPGTLDGLDIELRFRFENRLTQIVDARVASDEVDPGRPARVVVTLRRYGQPDERRTLTVPIPESAAGSEVELTVLAGDDVPAEDPVARNLSDLLATFARRLPATTLVAQLRLPARGLRFEGHVARDLPGSAIDALQLANGSTAAQPFSSTLRTTFPIDEVLTGSARVRLRVRETPRAQP